jgi:RNA polymerase sigma-70 factor (ECF subfamily)
VARRAKAVNVISLEEAVSARTGSGEGIELATQEASAEDLLVGQAERALVVKALAELSPPFREAIMLREMEELSYQDIATIAGVPVGTVMSRLSRARAQLRARLTELIEKEDRNAV